MTRIGGIKQLHSGRWVYDIPMGNKYRCKKCDKIVVEHIWVGNGWRGHIERMHRHKISPWERKIFRDCSCSNCEINHKNECDGELELIKEGKDGTTSKTLKRKIDQIVKEIMEPVLEPGDE